LIADLETSAYPRILSLNRQYRDLRLGFVDAAVMAIAELLGIRRLATTDRRDFGAVQLDLELELLP
jgi:predicted nucleic acid-binding protein